MAALKLPDKPAAGVGGGGFPEKRKEKKKDKETTVGKNWEKMDRQPQRGQKAPRL